MLLWEIPKVDRKRSLREVLTEWLHGKLFAMATTEGRFVDKMYILNMYVWPYWIDLIEMGASQG